MPLSLHNQLLDTHSHTPHCYVACCNIAFECCMSHVRCELSSTSDCHPNPSVPMSLLTNLLGFLPWNVPSVVWHQSHSSADYEYGVGGRHAKPCRACTDFQSWFANNTGGKTNKFGGGGGGDGDANRDTSAQTTAQPSERTPRADCPLDKSELGRSTWGLLHSMAAYYPDEPSADDRSSMTQFIHGLARFYPCEPCAIDFRHDIELHPPDTSSREALSQWWCGAHNRVNQKIGKPQFDCSKLDQRWLEGWNDGSCG